MAEKPAEASGEKKAAGRSLTKLNMRRTVLVTLPFMGALTFWQAYDGLVPLMFKNTFGMGDTLTGVFMSLDNVLALFMLPLMGALSDRTTTRWGRRTPFIVVGALLAAALTPLIAVANAMHNLPLFVTVLVATLVVLSIYRSPSVALMPDVTPRPVRSKADAFNSLMAAVGGVIVLVAIALLVPAEENPDYIPVYLVISFMLLVTTIIFMVFFREPKEVAAMHRESAELGIPEDEIEASDEGGKERETDPVKRRSLVCVLVCVFFYFMSNNAVTSGISRYADVVWGMAGGSYAQVQTVATLAAIVAYMPMAELSCKIGRKVTTYIGIALMVVSPLLISGATGFSAIIYVWVALFGIGMATVSLTVYPMIMELASANSTGRYTGFYYTASMSAQVVTPVPLLFVKNADSLTMDEVRERQAAAEKNEQ